MIQEFGLWIRKKEDNIESVKNVFYYTWLFSKFIAVKGTNRLLLNYPDYKWGAPKGQAESKGVKRQSQKKPKED